MPTRYEPEGELENRVRAALEPPPAQVRRLVERALGRSRSRRLPPLAVAAAAASSAAALLLVAVLLVPALRRTEPSAAARYALWNRDGVVVVRALDGGATSLRSGERPSEPPAGMMLIVRGETRP